MPHSLPSVFGIDLDYIVFGIAKEQRPVAPRRQVGWFSDDGHTLGDQLRMARVYG
jgi:hypothetical protein